MAGYAKVFADIVHSTVWREDVYTKVVWITMLVMADRHGLVMSSIPGLADAAKVSLEQCLSALDVLSSPDKYSRTKEYEGRRISEVDGGWLLLNFEKFRARKDDEEQRIRTVERVRKHRQKLADDAKNEQVTKNVTVTRSNPIAEATSSASPEATPSDNTLDASRPKHEYTPVFEIAWQHYPKRSGGNSKPKAFKAWTARTKQGVKTHEMADGVVRYHKYCVASGKLNTEYVMQASTFFGPDNHYVEPWIIPSGGNHATRQPVDNSAVGKVRRANEERERRSADAQRQADGSGMGANGQNVRPPLDQ